jgi:hypothetical protein
MRSSGGRFENYYIGFGLSNQTGISFFFGID